MPWSSGLPPQPFPTTSLLQPLFCLTKEFTYSCCQSPDLSPTWSPHSALTSVTPVIKPREVFLLCKSWIQLMPRWGAGVC